MRESDNLIVQVRALMDEQDNFRGALIYGRSEGKRAESTRLEGDLRVLETVMGMLEREDGDPVVIHLSTRIVTLNPEPDLVSSRGALVDDSMSELWRIE